MNDANDSHRPNDKSHDVTRKVEKRGVNYGGLADKTTRRMRQAKQREKRKGAKRAGRGIAGEDATVFAVTGVTFRLECMSRLNSQHDKGRIFEREVIWASF